MLENIRLSFQGIWSHKMRSFLTMLGIIIGIAAIIAIVSTIKGTNDQIEKNLIGSGENNVNVMIYQGDYAYEFAWSGIPEGISSITDDMIDRIEAQDHVESVSLYHKRQDYDGGVYYQSTTLSGGFVYGVDENYFSTVGYIIRKGRGFTAGDMAKSRKVVILDEDSASSLFQGVDPIGKTIEIKKEPFTVIGIVQPKKKYEPVINSWEDYYTYSNDNYGKIYIPDVTWPIIYQYDEPQSVVVRADSTSAMTTIGKNTADILNESVKTKDTTIKYKAEDLLEQAKEIQQLSQSTNSMLIWIAGISLLVGGIGVMNIMLVSVTERTSEIGLKKAIGAPKNYIMGQFLTEAVVLTSLGGILGVIVGIILAQVISKLNETPVSISVPAAILSVLFSMAIGIIFGMLPSYKAANLDPIEALRHE